MAETLGTTLQQYYNAHLFPLTLKSSLVDKSLKNTDLENMG